MPWLDPSLSLRWGPYTKLDGDEQAKIVDATLKAKQGGIITTRMAVEKVGGIFGIENVDAALNALEQEQQATDAREIAKTTAQATAEQDNLHRLASENAKADRGRGGGQSSGASKGRGGGGSAAASSSE